MGLPCVVALWYHRGMNETSFNLRMSKDLKARLEGLAKKDGRSLNNLINKVLCDFVAKEIVGRHRKEKRESFQEEVARNVKLAFREEEK